MTTVLLLSLLLSTIRLTTPLLLAGLGGLYSERSGVINIALEGVMLAGGFTAASVTYYSGNPWLGLLAAIGAGVLVSLVHALACIRFRADQVVSGMAINILFLGLPQLLAGSLFGSTGATPQLPKDQLLPVAPVVIAFALVPLTWYVLDRTRFGLRLRAVGENPEPADTAGVGRIRYLGVLLSGALAAIAGAYLSTGQASLFTRNMSAGRGFIALAARRIVFFNLAALVVLVSGILYLNQFREGLIDARVESLLTQGEIIAGAISASASVDTNSITIDPEKLLELQAGQSITPLPSDENLDFPIDPERVAPVLRRLISPTRTRARLFDADANLLLDSRHLYSQRQVLRFDLPPIDPLNIGIGDRFMSWINRLLQPGNLPLYKESPGGDGSIYPEVTNALTGVRGAVVRVTEKGELIVSVAVPVQRSRAVLGVLLLSTQAGDIDKIVHAERLAIMRMAGVATLVNIALSLMLSSTIANPLRRLSAAAIRVRRGAKQREEIPDFSYRQDEIGNLSIALRAMTTALYDRIDAIESFAADVSHELKNPLTSLRSAVETLPLAKNEDSKRRLTDIILHDVRRLDRLISDISDASRLDAELARTDAAPVDMEVLLGNLVNISRQIRSSKKPVELDYVIDQKPGSRTGFVVSGHDLRLGQIVTNLIENARSFVPEKDGRITVRLSRNRDRCIVQVEDNGPGIQAENIDRIFERFYTDRPEGESFGQNSGLGLSISRQIAEAHGGTLGAENIHDADTGNIQGARFVLNLPAETKA